MTIFLQVAFNAVNDACVYALVAVGFSIVFGVSRIVNIAYGDFLSLGAYIAFAVAPSTAIGFVWGFGAAALSVGIICVLCERFLFRRTLVQPVNGFLVSLGLVQIIENVLAYSYAKHPIVVVAPDSAVLRVGGVFMPADDLLVIGGTVALLAGVVMFMERTRVGLSIRAVSNDREMASLCGAPVARLIAGVFLIGGLLAGAGGTFIAGSEAPSPYLGSELMLKGFVVALVGGLGSVRGALIGAFVLAVFETGVIWSLVWFQLGGWLDPIEFLACFILLLILRPVNWSAR